MRTAKPPTASDPTALAHRWTEMWNRACPARDVVSADCRVYFGRKPQIDRPTITNGPHELQGMIDAIWKRFPGIHYRADSKARYQADSDDGASGLITLLWNVDVPGDGTRTGIDLLRQRAGVIIEVWSITGDLELPPLEYSH
jgi:hypothetical protein